MGATALPRREREALLRVVSASAAANDLEGVLELAALEARAAIGAASLSICRFEDEGRRYRTLINVGELGPEEVAFPKDEIYEVSEYARLQEMMLTGKPYFNSIDDPKTDPATIELLTRLGKSSDLGVAIDIEGERWGGIWASTLAKTDRFRSEDLRFLEAVAAQIAAAISRAERFARVSRLAYEDSLTGLANRRAVEERLERAIARHETDGIAISILLCDVDRLKATNDIHGHAAGDAALRRVGAALTASAADYPGSFVGRIGGDEFCVLLESKLDESSGGAQPQASLIADLGAAAQRLLAGDGDASHSASVSCGIATLGPQTKTPSQLLQAADAAQYLAKRRGGNRICTAAQAAEERSDWMPNPCGDSRERFWRTTEEIARSLDGELRDASTLDRLEVVATTFTATGDLARWAISYAADGKNYLRDLALGDNRERRHTGARVAPTEAHYEVYDLDDYPLTREMVAAGGGSFVTRIDDPEGDPSEQALLVKEGFQGVVGAVAGDDSGVYLIELVADLPDAALEEMAAPLRMSICAAIAPHAHQRELAPPGHRARALDLAMTLPGRLSEATDVDGICETAVEEAQRAFDCSIAHVVSIEGEMFEMRASRGPREPEVGYTQRIDAGLMGRCLTERRTVLSEDVSRDPGYRSTGSAVGVQSELAAPIATTEGLWGVINLEDNALNAFDEGDAKILEAAAALIGGAINSFGLYERLDRAYLGTAEALSAALEAKDSPTATHSQSITENAVAVGRQFGMSGNELRMLRYAAAFHDIGKLAIPRHILNKPGPLDPEEWEEMKKHTVIGDRILQPIEFLNPIRPLVRHAHERWDGKGYPDGLAGEAIPLGARIVFACDAFDAMTTDRTYNPARSVEEAKEELRRGAGSQFDPRVIEVLLEVLE